MRDASIKQFALNKAKVNNLDIGTMMINWLKMRQALDLNTTWTSGTRFPYLVSVNRFY